MGKITRRTVAELDIDTIVLELNQGKTSKYLDLEEGKGI